jgi:hypothetical protein
MPEVTEYHADWLMRASDSRCKEASKNHPTSFVLVSLVEDSLLFCMCSASEWHQFFFFFFAFFVTHEDDTTPDFRNFSISHVKQIVNCRQSIS